MPFSTYSTFANAQVRYEDYESYRQAGSGTAFRSYKLTGDEGFIVSSSSSGSYTFFYEFTRGLNVNETKQGTTSESAFSQYTALPNTSGGVDTSDATGSAGLTTSEVGGIKTIFVPNNGFLINAYTSNTSYSFSDYTDDSRAIGKVDTTADNSSFYLSKTRLTTRTDTILGDSTTWTDVTTTFRSAQRTYTALSIITEYGTAIDGIGTADDFSEEALILEPHFGSDWTRDGSSLEYLHIFTSEGSFGPFHTYIVKDNKDSNSEFPAQKTRLSSNIQYQLGQTTIYTVVSSSNRSITYDYLTYAGGTTLTFGTSYSFNGIQFYENTSSQSSYSFPKLTKSSTSTSQILNEEVLLDGEISDSDWNYAFYTTTRAIQAVSTDIFYAIDQTLSYFNSFTYRGTINTTTTQKYVLLDAGVFGSFSDSSTTSSVFTEENTMLNYTVSDSYRSSISQSYNSGLYARIFYKNFYSLQIGVVNDAWTKSYTQYSPNFKYVVGGESNSINGYRQSLIPTALVTKLYFTTYKFERGGAVNAPILAIPIDYTSESNSGTQSFYTYQSVSVPNEFCLGSASASVYWTQSVAGGTTNTTSSFTLAYAGVSPILSLGEYYENDFSGGLGEPAKIYHTKGLVNTANAANWSKNGYYYWNSNIRLTSGSTPNAISVIGDGQPITYIATEWVADLAFPVVFILKSHANSYSY